MASNGEIRRSENPPRLTALEFYQDIHDECEEEAEKMKEELKTTADELSRLPSPRSRRHGALFHSVSLKMASHVKKELESQVYKQLWEEAHAAVFRNLATWRRRGWNSRVSFFPRRVLAFCDSNSCSRQLLYMVWVSQTTFSRNHTYLFEEIKMNCKEIGRWCCTLESVHIKKKLCFWKLLGRWFLTNSKP